MLKLIRVFAGMAIFIGCLGLYGMALFMAHQKRKEIGIRKVLGSSSYQILFLFVREFSLLVLMAFVEAAPMGWMLMRKWLESFVYQVEIELEVFLATMLFTMFIALLTVSSQVMKAALTNPVKSLRS